MIEMTDEIEAETAAETVTETDEVIETDAAQDLPITVPAVTMEK